jgi:hypothetical protein
MIRLLLFFLLLTLWSCSHSSQESPAPPPQPPATQAAGATPAPTPAPAEPAKPAPVIPPVPARAADLAMAVTTTDLQLVTKKGLRTKEGAIIQGKVRNNTDKDYHFVEISFKLFDKDDKEVALVRATTDSLEAGRTWYFEIKAPYPTAVTSIMDRLGGF